MFLVLFYLRFFSIFKKGYLHSGRSKVTRVTVGRDIHQSSRVCKGNLATPEGRNRRLDLNTKMLFTRVVFLVMQFSRRIVIHDAPDVKHIRKQIKQKRRAAAALQELMQQEKKSSSTKGESKDA